MAPTGTARTPDAAPGSWSGLPVHRRQQVRRRAMYRPDQEPVADYLMRVSRIVLALHAHGVVMDSRDLDTLSTKATLLADEFAQIGGETKMVRRCGPGSRSRRFAYR